MLHPELVKILREESRQYVARHHDYIKVAKRYEKVYKSLNAPSVYP